MEVLIILAVILVGFLVYAVVTFGDSELMQELKDNYQHTEIEAENPITGNTSIIMGFSQADVDSAMETVNAR